MQRNLLNYVIASYVQMPSVAGWLSLAGKAGSFLQNGLNLDASHRD